MTRVVPQAAERSTDVLASSLALILLFWQWRPLGNIVWDVQHPVGRGLAYTGFAFGWMLVLVTTFLIIHFDLFGLRQVWFHLRGKPCEPLRFVTPGSYRLIRHPLDLGWLFAFWATPTMTVTHLLFAAVTTAYILLARRFEKRDLVAAHPEYGAHRQRVPMIIPVGGTAAPQAPDLSAGARVRTMTCFSGSRRLAERRRPRSPPTRRTPGGTRSATAPALRTDGDPAAGRHRARRTRSD